MVAAFFIALVYSHCYLVTNMNTKHCIPGAGEPPLAVYQPPQPIQPISDASPALMVAALKQRQYEEEFAGRHNGRHYEVVWPNCRLREIRASHYLHLDDVCKFLGIHRVQL